MNRKSFNRLLLLSVTALGGSLSMLGCDQSGSASSPVASVDPARNPDAQAAGYVKEVIALKGRESDAGKLDAALRDLQTKYGYADRASFAPIATAPEAPLLSAENPPPPLGKTAAGTVSKYYSPRNFNFGLTLTPALWVTVPANGKLEAFTTRAAGDVSVDPMLVGFYQTSGSSGDLAFRTRSTGIYDDYQGGLDPYLTWTNTTGASQRMCLVAFAFRGNTTGPVTLRYFVQNVSSGSIGGLMQATRDTAYTPTAPGCTGPTLSRMQLQRLSGQAADYNLLAYNFDTKRGGYISRLSTSLILEDLLPVSGSFYLAYTPINASGYYISSTYKASQLDLYSCPAP